MKSSALGGVSAPWVEGHELWKLSLPKSLCFIFVTRVIRNPAGMYLRNEHGWTPDFIDAAKFENINPVFALIEKLGLNRFDLVTEMGQAPSSSDTVFRMR